MTNSTFNNLLFPLPASLRDELVAEFNKILKNYRESRWEPAELNGGKLCEIIYTILEGYFSSTYSTKASKPQNFFKACLDFEKQDKKKYPRSARIKIPRVLIPLYEFRNNRNVGHVGADVNPNRMDATYVVATAKWLIAELIRIYHNVSIDTATRAIDLLVQKETQAIWEIGRVKRVLNTSYTSKEKVLLLLYNCGSSQVSDLFEWIEHSNKGVFKKILLKLHKERLVEYEQKSGAVHISPNGILFVENSLLK
ncbi:MAG: hypothetical protein GC185_08300 [Alphaproteobacteria bacterium]|nr:hypothetical protein [Alphaproteobacteria bacterium]